MYLLNFLCSLLPDECLSEISRVLKPKDAKFLSLTFSQPHFRLPFYAKTKYNWNVSHESYGTGFQFSCFVMTKGETLKISNMSATQISNVILDSNQDFSSSSDEEDGFTKKFDFELD